MAAVTGEVEGGGDGDGMGAGEHGTAASRRRWLGLGEPDGVDGGSSFSVSRFVARTGEEAVVFIPRDL